jgi:tetratricopeptide (TPR) repeat protein
MVLTGILNFLNLSFVVTVILGFTLTLILNAVIKKFGKPTGQRTIKEFDRAQQIDSNDADAYFNRGKKRISLWIAAYPYLVMGAGIIFFVSVRIIEMPAYATFGYKLGHVLGTLLELFSVTLVILLLSLISRKVKRNKWIIIAWTFIFASILYLGLAQLEHSMRVNTEKEFHQNQAKAGTPIPGIFDNLEAVAYFDSVLQINPNDNLAYYGRGMVYADMGAYDLAIADYSYVIQHIPNDAGAYNGRGIAYFKKGDELNAKLDLQRAVDLGNEDAKCQLEKMR